MELIGLTSEQVAERVATGLRNVSSETRTKRTREIIFDNLFSIFNLIVALMVAFLLFFYFRTRDDRLILDSLGVFTVALINGDRFTVDHPEALVLRKGVAVFLASDGTPTIFDHESVSEFIAESKSKKHT